MGKKIIITGSSGYIGSVLLPYLEKNGMECVGYDAGFFADSFLYPAQPVKTVYRDTRDIGEEDLRGAYAVVHLAGISNDPLKKLDTAQVYDPTRAYSLEIARLCKKMGIKFIFSSSCSVYGKGGEEFLTESSPTYPQTPYSLNKLQIESDLASIADKNFSPIALRFATIFGLSPRIRFDLVANMFAAMAVTSGEIVLNSDGSPWRPNVHILDVCESIRRAIELDYREGKLLILNVGDESNNLQVIRMAEIVREEVPGSELKFLSKDPRLDKEGLIGTKLHKGIDTRTYKVSFSKIREIMPGFRAGRSFRDGIREMVELFKKLPLTKEIFKNRGFYRLQQLEYLHDNGYLSDDLRWIKDRPRMTA